MEARDVGRGKAEMLSAMRTGRAKLEALLAKVGEERMAEPGVVGEWSVRDVIAHLTAYERWLVAMLRAERQGEAPREVDLYGRENVPPEVKDYSEDEYNDWVVAYNRDRPLREVLAESRRAHDDLMKVIAVLPVSDLADPGRFSWLAGRSVFDVLPNQSFAHYRMHMPEVYTWLNQVQSSA